MLRIWLTEYKINPITDLGEKCGPNIEAPSEKIAQSICESMKLNYRNDLRVIGYLVAEVPCKKGFNQNDITTWEPDWSKIVDYEIKWMN